MTEAILYPGQGAQFEGMGRDWCEAFEPARRTFDEADAVLGFGLSTQCWASGDVVHRTDIAQPGIFTTSVAITRAQFDRGLDPWIAPMVAGLSLGEYTALWAAGVIDFADALRLVRLRGVAMQEASDACPSGMVSLMGGDEQKATTLAGIGSEFGICQVANLNAPGQVIVSGELAALDAVEAAAREHGVKRTRRLTVAGGFHSECMRPAADRLAAALEDMELRAPKVPVLSNVTAAPADHPDRIKELLAKQVCSPVRWEDSMRWAAGRGITHFLEPGPGKVLAGLMGRIAPEAVVRSAATPADIGLDAGS